MTTSVKLKSSFYKAQQTKIRDIQSLLNRQAEDPGMFSEDGLKSLQSKITALTKLSQEKAKDEDTVLEKLDELGQVIDFLGKKIGENLEINLGTLVTKTETGLKIKQEDALCESALQERIKDTFFTQNKTYQQLTAAINKTLSSLKEACTQVKPDNTSTSAPDDELKQIIQDIIFKVINTKETDTKDKGTTIQDSITQLSPRLSNIGEKRFLEVLEELYPKPEKTSSTNVEERCVLKYFDTQRSSESSTNADFHSLQTALKDLNTQKEQVLKFLENWANSDERVHSLNIHIEKIEKAFAKHCLKKSPLDEAKVKKINEALTAIQKKRHQEEILKNIFNADLATGGLATLASFTTIRACEKKSPQEQRDIVQGALGLFTSSVALSIFSNRIVSALVDTRQNPLWHWHPAALVTSFSFATSLAMDKLGILTKKIYKTPPVFKDWKNLDMKALSAVFSAASGPFGARVLSALYTQNISRTLRLLLLPAILGIAFPVFFVPRTRKKTAWFNPFLRNKNTHKVKSTTSPVITQKADRTSVTPEKPTQEQKNSEVKLIVPTKPQVLAQKANTTPVTPEKSAQEKKNPKAKKVKVPTEHPHTMGSSFDATRRKVVTPGLRVRSGIK